MGFRDLFFRRRPWDEPACRLYDRAVAQARSPAFYSDCGIPDTLDGRFETVVLHVFLLLHRLKSSADDGEDLHALGEALTERMIVNFDESLREIGVGDLSVGKKVRFMAKATYGRIAAYDDGLRRGDDSLGEALRRNLFGTVAAPLPGQVAICAAYVRRTAARLAGQAAADLAAGRVDFGPAPSQG